jgi:hypothetical protein
VLGKIKSVINSLQTQLPPTIVILDHQPVFFCDDERPVHCKALPLKFIQYYLYILGPVQEGDIWRIRYNQELNRLIEGKNNVKFIKAQRIRWLDHVKRMEGGAMPRRTMEGRLFIGRRKGIPRLRWMDG